MAHAATLTGLAESLVTGTTGLTPSDVVFSRLRDRTIRGLRDQTHARTNQFAINASFDGLVEKFGILNRDDLADGLKSRLEELPTNSKWMPELLSLLLELSDRPAEKTVFANVENANKPSELESGLTWDDIIAADPLDEPGIWESVERGYHSSGDEFGEEAVSEPTTSTSATSIDGFDPAAIARLHLTQPDDSALKGVRASRSVWQSGFRYNESLSLSELTVVREMLPMLRGLPTDLFRKDEGNGRVTITRNISLDAVSKSSLIDVLESATGTGRALNSLRRWTADPQQPKFQQSIQSAVHILISAFDERAVDLEKRFIALTIDVVVSALEVLSEIQIAATPLVRISLLTQLSSMSMGANAPVALLDYLYDEVGIAQMAGDSALLKDLGSVFFAGLRTYLRPVSEWITTGRVSVSTEETFFIRDAIPDCNLSVFWHERYELRRQHDGTPLAPKCIIRFARRIFALGKGRSFLARLDPSAEDPDRAQTYGTQLPELDSVQRMLELDTLMPFSQLLSDRIDSWLAEISVDCTPMLRMKIAHEHGLSRTMHALPLVYFSKNGSYFQGFAESLLNRMKAAKAIAGWNDRFWLTELAQTTLGASTAVDGENLFVSISEPEHSLTTLSMTRKLEQFSLCYSFSWPVQNITGCSTPESHARGFTFMLQLHCAATLLRGRFFDLRADKVDNPAILKLRKGLLWLVELLQHHVTTAAQEVHEHFLASLERAGEIDAMVYAWASYVNRLQTCLLLTDALEPVRNSITDALELNEVLAKAGPTQGIAGLQDKFEDTLRFLMAGVRGVSRAGGEPSLEALAERLEWGAHASGT